MMKNKLFILFLTFCLILSVTSISFGLTEPEKPVIDETNPEATNELIEDYNDKVDEYNDEVDEYNEEVDDEYEEALIDYEEEKAEVEANNAFVDKVENKIEEDNSESRGFTNNTTHDAPTDWSDNTDENTLKTIQIEKSNNPSGEKIKVINLHVFLDETKPYSPDCYQTSIDRNTFELSKEMTDRAVLTEWETAEIDYDDKVTLFSEAKNFAGNIVWIDGKRQWFGADPKPYFFRAIEGYTQGYWMPGGSMMESTATVDEYGWSAGGETYTVQYAEKTAYSSYLYNGQPMIEEITVRTTDKQEPKNIFAIFTYLFTRLDDEPEKEDLPEKPIKGEYLSKLDYLNLLPVPDEPDELDKQEKPEEPTKKPTKNPTKNKPTIQTVASTTDIIVASDAPKAAPKAKATPIVDTPAPKAAPIGSWALINFIAMFLSCVCAIVLLTVKKKKKDDKPTKEEKNDMRGMVGTKLASLIIGIASIIIFIFTEDMTLPMVYTDKWTFLMILLLIVEIINIFIMKQQSKGEEDDD